MVNIQRAFFLKNWRKQKAYPKRNGKKKNYNIRQYNSNYFINYKVRKYYTSCYFTET